MPTLKHTRSGDKHLIPIKEAKVLEGLAEGKDPAVAVVEAGYDLTPDNATRMAKALWKKHMTGNATVLEALENVGITPERVAGKLNQLLDAKKKVRALGGEVVGEDDDNQSQLKALDMTFKVVGGYAPTKTENTTISFEHILLEIDGDHGDDGDN